MLKIKTLANTDSEKSKPGCVPQFILSAKRQLSLVSLQFHFNNIVIPKCYLVKLGTSFIGNLFVYAKFLLEACRHDDNSL